jgi:aminopeptidase N
MHKRFFLHLSLLLLLASACQAQPLSQKKAFTRQDTLRGTITPERAWWDVLHYNISVTPDYESRTIKGIAGIRFKTLADGKRMQIDLQEPMQIDSIVSLGTPVSRSWREKNVYWVEFSQSIAKGSNREIVFYFSGKPRAAKNAPWDGGWIWKTDAQGRPWMSVACQGLGASVWFPCKDHQSDEPDNGSTLTVNIVDTLVAVANGKLKNKVAAANGMASYTWEVTNPINNYNIIPYIGKYVNFTETFTGEKGKLNCSYWVLDYNLDKARRQFTQVPMTLKAFEYWFGPYPFYEDDFKLVEAPHLGMEHQSAVAYGNKYQNGYLGRDLSGTGVGLKWDFIIVHETGHEWFGNNITTKDVADMWVHEGFTSYSETLFSEFHFGKDSANAYVQGIRGNISNDMPIIGHYGVNQEGSGDMYYKGSNMLHTIRQIVNDDAKFRNIIRGLNKDFYHQTVTTRQVEDYISKQSGKNLSKVFDQYLRTKDIPVLELKSGKNGLQYRWTNCVTGFNMPIKLTTGQWLYPTTQMQTLKGAPMEVEVDKNFYVKVKRA